MGQRHGSVWVNDVVRIMPRVSAKWVSGDYKGGNIGHKGGNLPLGFSPGVEMTKFPRHVVWVNCSEMCAGLKKNAVHLS